MFKGSDSLRSENKIPHDVGKELGLTRDQLKKLHREIGGEGHSTYQEILQVAKDLFGK